MRIENTNIVNNDGSSINPASDETVLLLRRIVKMMESNTVVDGNMRQRMIVDSAVIFGAYSIGATGTNYPTAGVPLSTAGVSYLATWAGPIDPRWTNLEQAGISYNTGIRNNLI